VELSEMIRRQIGGYKVPDRFEFVPELPRTPLMKINRKALREQLSAPSGSV
jgi:acyl-coenzyme A synthetase/AMP-(fatty) acid ligase